MTKLLSLAASYRPDSLNRMLVDYAAKIAHGLGATIESLDYATIDSPMYRDEDTTLPDGAMKLKAAIARNHGILLAAPEYNWSMPGSLKNLIDWLSVDSQQAFKGKTILLLSASPSERGGRMGLQQLRVPLEVLGGYVFPNIISIGNAKRNLIANAITVPKEAQYVTDTVTDFVNYTRRLCD
ncbi:MAG: NADPH-dependent FMN reductase [Rickettsiales bacterium]